MSYKSGSEYRETCTRCGGVVDDAEKFTHNAFHASIEKLKDQVAINEAKHSSTPRNPYDNT